MVVSHDEWIRRADSIGQKASLEVAEAEKSGCFSLELRDYVHQMELHKLLRPVQYGGSGAGAHTFSEVVRTIATYNASAAWLCYFVSLHEQWVAFLPEEGRQDIYKSDGFVGDIFFPMGKVEYVDGGVNLSGQWQFGSGSLWDDWFGLGAFVQTPDDEQALPCLVTVHKDDFEIIHDWNPFGLRGTGSNSLKVDNVFVPWKHILPLAPVKQRCEPVGGKYSDEPIFRSPFMPFFCLGFPAISLGITQRITKDLKQRIFERQRVLFDSKEWESPVAQRNLAETMVLADNIEALHQRYIQQLEDWNTADRPVVPDSESSRMNAWRSKICKDASDLAFHAMNLLGASATSSGDPMEIAARDAFMIYIHLGQIYEDNMLAYGRTQYGLPGHPLL